MSSERGRNIVTSAAITRQLWKWKNMRLNLTTKKEILMLKKFTK